MIYIHESSLVGKLLALVTEQPTYSNFFFFNDTATTEIYTLSLHDALPISGSLRAAGGSARPPGHVGSGLAHGSANAQPPELPGLAARAAARHGAAHARLEHACLQVGRIPLDSGAVGFDTDVGGRRHPTDDVVTS